MLIGTLENLHLMLTACSTTYVNETPIERTPNSLDLIAHIWLKKRVTTQECYLKNSND
jgi:hypothetical protein